MKDNKKLLIFTILFLPALALSSVAQPLPQRPELIRDTDVAEGKEDTDVAKPKEYNPLQGEKSYKIGNFYYKKKNYIAAIDRYLEALEYNPKLKDAHKALAKAYEKLARDYEKKGEIDKAIDTYEEFISNNPESSKSSEFRTKLAKLKQK